MRKSGRDFSLPPKLKTKLFCFREIILAYSAKRTLKVFGKILELCAGLDAVIRITELLIIFPSAYITLLSIH